MTPGSALLPVALAVLAVLLLVPPAARLPRPTGRSARPGHGPDDRLPPAAVAGAVLGAGLGVALLVGGPVGVLLGATAGAVAHVVVRRVEVPAVRRRREAMLAALPHAVDLLAAGLAAGQSPGAVVDQVTGVVDEPLRRELAAVSARLRLGVDPVTVWRDLADHPQLGPLGRCLHRASESGASVAEAMTRLAEDLRSASRSAVEARARAVGVRAALPLGVCLLPAFVLLGVVPLVAGSVSVLSLP